MAASARFPELSEDEIENILDLKSSLNTKKATNVAVNLFRQYISHRNIQEEEAVSSKPRLAEVLRKFYAEARKRNGDLYTRASLICIRFGLQRFFSSSHNMDIIKETEFNNANSVFLAELSELKREGKTKTTHKPSIYKADITKLYQSGQLNVDKPETLQNKVFFEVMLYFCRRGRQNLRDLKKEDFRIGTDPDGVKYVYKAKDELTKNHRENDEAQETQTMFASDGASCPVLSLISTQRMDTSFKYDLPRPRKSIKPTDEIWYDNMVVGLRTLGDKMKRISTAAELSYVYTNHSIRTTSITILDECGYEARHIMAVSGHRNENSIRSNASRTSLSTKRNMLDAISKFNRRLA